METFLRIFRTPELRNSLLFILFTVTVFRIAAHIPVPGIDASGLAALLEGNQFLGLLNVFSGGTLTNFSIVALGVAPYITASIIFQLLGMILPSMEELQKEEQGRAKINRWTRFATVPLCFLQGFALIRVLSASSVGFAVTGWDLAAVLVSMAAGTVFLMWLGELISERKVGNGMSILIFAGIIAGLPATIGQLAATYTGADILNMVVFVLLILVTIVGVVVVSEGQRNIPVQYARGGARGAGGKVQSSLPLRVNIGGMIPIMFALSIIVLPTLLAQFFTTARTQIVRDIAQGVTVLFSNNLFHAIAYFLLVFGFTFFYASIVFRPEQVAENLQKQGGFIPGVRPGEQTAKYIQWVINRLLLTGALFLSTIAILPNVVQAITGNQNVIVGGSSVIIIVSVVIDIVKQVQSQLTMRSYDVS
ncbi:MAG: preprotein translocase subunit SecY [Candidatus Uhrbacteria bacterium]|nr:preprotein translocase subunit SecY [Candidatus Uhrbacteria bacterium]